MNVTELARQLKITKVQLFDEIEKLGFDIGRRAIKIDDRQAKKIRTALEGKIKAKSTLVVEEEIEEKEVVEGKKIDLPDRIIIRDLAEKISMPVVELLGVLMKNGIMSSQNEEIDYETANIILEDLGYQVVLAKQEEAIHEEIQETSLKNLLAEEDSKKLITKPPVVVVLGHVDHGKTALLDAIRNTDVIGSESGGITQHIGAYQMVHNNKKITFVDTPGHAAFTKMRGRGAKVADIAILVIAADDGIKPQTEEAISIIKEAKIPFIVAINKVDKPDADIQKVKQQLTQNDLNPEEWGGKVICQEVSAKAKTGIKELLDIILLMADLEKANLLANPDREAVGCVIESHIDKGEGPVATVLINTGTLKVADLVTVGEVAGKVKALKDHTGQAVTQAEPAKPVRIIGLKGMPKVGDILHKIDDQKLLKKKLKEQHQEKMKVIKEQVQPAGQPSSKKKGTENLNILIKTDNLGSQEAIIGSLNKLRGPDVAINIVRKGLGNITGQDVIQADSTNSWLLGFHVNLTNEAQEVMLSRNFNRVKTFSIIYELIDEAKKNLTELIKPEIIRDDLGKIQVLALFRKAKNKIIIGGKVIKGKIFENSKFEVVRDKEIIGQGQLIKLQIAKREVKEITEGSECGLELKGFTDIEEGDKLTIYQEQEKARQLDS